MTFDTSDDAQEARIAAMAERLAAADAATASELSPLCGRAIVVDGVAAWCIKDFCAFELRISLRLF